VNLHPPVHRGWDAGFPILRTHDRSLVIPNEAKDLLFGLPLASEIGFRNNLITFNAERISSQFNGRIIE
jgi:hypothetical protein